MLFEYSDFLCIGVCSQQIDTQKIIVDYLLLKFARTVVIYRSLVMADGRHE